MTKLFFAAVFFLALIGVFAPREAHAQWGRRRSVTTTTTHGPYGHTTVTTTRAVGPGFRRAPVVYRPAPPVVYRRGPVVRRTTVVYH